MGDYETPVTELARCEGELRKKAEEDAATDKYSQKWRNVRAGIKKSAQQSLAKKARTKVGKLFFLKLMGKRAKAVAGPEYRAKAKAFAPSCAPRGRRRGALWQSRQPTATQSARPRRRRRAMARAGPSTWPRRRRRRPRRRRRTCRSQPPTTGTRAAKASTPWAAGSPSGTSLASSRRAGCMLSASAGSNAQPVEEQEGAGGSACPLDGGGRRGQ